MAAAGAVNRAVSRTGVKRHAFPSVIPGRIEISKERMLVVKKLIALLLIAGFLVLGAVGCTTPTTKGPSSSTPATH
jgi:hypothetical protein